MTTIEHVHSRGHEYPAFIQAAIRRYGNWQTRRQVRKIAGFETRMLDDMGVTRDEVLWAAKLPLSVNAAWELRHRSRTRRLAEGAIR